MIEPNDAPQVTYVNPPELGKPSGFSHAVVGRGRTVFLAGQTALDATGVIVGDTVPCAQPAEAPSTWPA